MGDRIEYLPRNSAAEISIVAAAATSDLIIVLRTPRIVLLITPIPVEPCINLAPVALVEDAEPKAPRDCIREPCIFAVKYDLNIQ